MRPPILKAWNRIAVQFRGIYSNRYGIGGQSGGSSGDSGEVTVVDGFNFQFNFDGDITWLYFYDLFLNPYLVRIQNGTQYEIVAAAGGVASTAPPPTGGGNYIFSSDGYMRFKDNGLNTGLYLRVNSVDGTLEVEALPGQAPFGTNAASVTYNPGINFVIQNNTFYFKDEFGNKWEPLIVEEALNTYSIQLTYVP